MSTHNLCFEQKYEKYRGFCLKIFEFLEVKSSIHLNRYVFVMKVLNIYINCVHTVCQHCLGSNVGIELIKRKHKCMHMKKKS